MAIISLGLLCMALKVQDIVSPDNYIDFADVKLILWMNQILRSIR